MFTLRQDRQVRKWIGENINCDWKVRQRQDVYHAHLLALVQVLGFINHIKGRADIEFQVHGTKGTETIFVIYQEFTLVLLQDQARYS